MSTEKQLILITGASNGIGLETSHYLAALSPNNHILMGCRNPTKGAEVLAELQARKPAGTLSLVELDVTSDSSINSAVEKIRADHGRLDVLINNAGICYKQGPTRDNLRDTFEVNVFGPTLLTEALLPLLKRSKNPKIINVTSTLGSITNRANPEDAFKHVDGEAYRMSKAAINMLSVNQYARLKDQGFMVWTYCPGWVVTDLTGREDRQVRIDGGADSPVTSAEGIADILTGKRDADVGGFVGRRGATIPW